MRRLLLLGVLVAGCGAQVGGQELPAGDDDGKGDGSGDGTGDGGGSGGGELRAGDFLVELGVVQCDHAFLCRTDFPADVGVTFEEAVGNSAPDCYADANLSLMPAEVEASVAAGRIEYDALAAAGCLAGITFAPTCPEYWQSGPQFPAVCGQSLIGTIEDGGSCTIDFDCRGQTSICTNQVCEDSNGAAFAPGRAARLRSLTY